MESIQLAERAVEDYNAEWIATSSSTAQSVTAHRRLICLPLDDGTIHHGSLWSILRSDGDKIRSAKVFLATVTETMPKMWLSLLRRIDGVTGNSGL
jgi:hypothetical protein